MAVVTDSFDVKVTPWTHTPASHRLYTKHATSGVLIEIQNLKVGDVVTFHHPNGRQVNENGIPCEPPWGARVESLPFKVHPHGWAVDVTWGEIVTLFNSSTG